MEATETRSTLSGPRPEETTGPGFHQFASSTSSFTALLELPPNQAVDLLVHTPETIDISETTFQRQSNKRKDRDTKDKESNRKNRKTGEDLKGGVDEKLPYVHVRARRGQATDSHSIAERARREKINARMKLLQELVPGCNKISGTASVLDEIINHVQSLQRHVELLSMSLAAVDPGIDMKLDAYMAANGSLLGSNHLGIATPSVWSEEQIKPQYQQLWQLDGFQHPVWVKEEDTSNFVEPDTSLLSYDSSGNSAPLQTNDLKMQL